MKKMKHAEEKIIAAVSRMEADRSAKEVAREMCTGFIEPKD